LGNISAANYKKTEINKEQEEHKLRNLQLLDNLLEQINDKILTGLQAHP
jgi:hypothetical protein